MSIIISGAGIAGLTLALTTRKAGHLPIIIQQRAKVDKPSFGGGIGLWPPSQMVMERLGVLSQLQSHGLYMPSACYYDSSGYILAHPTPHFNTRYPVLCLEREQLTKSLYRKCLQQGVQFRVHTSVDTAHSDFNGVNVKLSNGQSLHCKMLVGTDGIGSKVRNIIMRERHMPEIIPHHCEYAYFRAVVDLKGNKHSEWWKHAFQSWGQKKRFGYVPLKEPKTFWFVAIPIGESGLQKIVGSHRCSQQQKKWILQQFQYWQSPINIKKLLQLTPANTILRTDICKVKDVTSFPWQSKNKNMIILGDAANATAPNLAQGAGLAIESAWDFISMVDLETRSGLSQYAIKRKRRAHTVQTLADIVAKTGQFDSPHALVRNWAMKNATYHMKSIEQRIFQQVVSHSVGGASNKLYWLPPNIPFYEFHKNIKRESSLLGTVMGPSQFNMLPQATRQFRSSLIAYGEGRVSVQSVAISALIGLPSNMSNKMFQAYCQTHFQKDGVQHMHWIRTFGKGEAGAVKFGTLHRNTPHLGMGDYGHVLTESFGFGIDLFRFGYLPIVSKKQTLYQSKGLWLRNYKLPIPDFLLPNSSWTEKQTEKGWEFDGQISMPKILGSFNIMKYKGTFQPQKYSRAITPIGKRVIIAGGTGMIGSVVSKQFYMSGWTVQILSRSISEETTMLFPFAKIHLWNPQQCFNPKQIQRLSRIFESADAVVNLSGENPGAGLWTSKVKDRILQSRLNSIRLLTSALNQVKSKNRGDKSQEIQYLQASAAGIYGHRESQVLMDSSPPSPLNTFRISTCKQIESLTKQLYPSACILRIGHVLSSQGGLFPHLELASRMRVRKFGRGGQFAPWVHIEDLASSLVHISQNREKYIGNSVNIVSPHYSTYDCLLDTLAKVRGRRACVVSVSQTVLRSLLGEMSSILLDSQRMHPDLLLKKGFNFKYGQLDKALTSRECL